MSYYAELYSGTRRAHVGHRCDSCGLPIARGSKYASRVYKWNGNFHDEMLHPWCRAELDLFFDSDCVDDFASWHEINEFIDEMLHDYGYDGRIQAVEEAS